MSPDQSPHLPRPLDEIDSVVSERASPLVVGPRRRRLLRRTRRVSRRGTHRRRVPLVPGGTHRGRSRPAGAGRGQNDSGGGLRFGAVCPLAHRARGTRDRARPLRGDAAARPARDRRRRRAHSPGPGHRGGTAVHRRLVRCRVLLVRGGPVRRRFGARDGRVTRILRPGGRWVFSVNHPMRWMFPDDPGPAGLTVSIPYFSRTPYRETDDDGIVTYVEHHRTIGDRVRDHRGGTGSRRYRRARVAGWFRGDLGPMEPVARQLLSGHRDLLLP